MPPIKTLVCQLCFLAGMATTGIAFAQTAADVPAGLSGTYQLTYSDFGTVGPFGKDEVVTVVVDGVNDTLCVKGTLLSKPYVKAVIGTFTSVVFADTSRGAWYAWLTTTTAPGTGNAWGLNVMQGTDTTFKGQLYGTRISTSTTCTGGSSATTPTVSTTVQSVFDLAAELYPALFKNGSALGIYQGYVYKFFADSKIYVGIKDDKIYTMGGIYGDAIKEQGAVTAVLNLLQTTKTNLNKPVTGGISLYKLTLSGTFKTSGLASVTIPITGITINDLPAPDVSDSTGIIDQVKTSLGASGIANVKVTAINNTAARVTFRVEFTAVLTGFGTVTYDLTYDYTK